MRVSWRTEVPQWLVLAALFIAAAASWPHAPDRIPVHWGISGAPDRFGGKGEGLLVPPLLALGIYLGLLFLPRFDPGRANYASFRGAYLAIRLAALAIPVAVSGVVLLLANGYPVDTSRAVPLVVG